MEKRFVPTTGTLIMVTTSSCSLSRRGSFNAPSPHGAQFGWVLISDACCLSSHMHDRHTNPSTAESLLVHRSRCSSSALTLIELTLILIIDNDRSRWLKLPLNISKLGASPQDISMRAWEALRPKHHRADQLLLNDGFTRVA